MTVCVAILFQWNYAPKGSPPEFGTAAITVSDRMITAGDVQYEPMQTKVAYITDNIFLLIAGDYSIHSQAIRDTVKRFKAVKSATPQMVSEEYARVISQIKTKHAEEIFL